MKKLLTLLLASLFFTFPAIAFDPDDVVHVDLVCKSPAMLMEVAEVHVSKNMQAAVEHIQSNKERWTDDCASLPMPFPLKLLEKVETFSGPGGQVTIWRGELQINEGMIVYVAQIIDSEGA